MTNGKTKSVQNVLLSVSIVPHIAGGRNNFQQINIENPEYFPLSLRLPVRERYFPEFLTGI